MTTHMSPPSPRRITTTTTATTALILVAATIAGAVPASAAPRSRVAGERAGDRRPLLDSAVRFRNAPIAATAPEPHLIGKPAARGFLRGTYFFDAYLGRRSERLLSPEVAGRAGNVNALDEVPDSSWFENRIGARPLAPGELLRRPVAPARAPFSVVGMKVGGMSPGFQVRDADGVGHLLKFDRPDDPDSETAADLVLQRLLWTVGYHTPEDNIVYFRDEDLRLDPRAKLTTKAGDTRTMTATDLRDTLAMVGREPDGRYRGLASRFLAGIPLGGYPQEGVRADDPNDVVPHEDRRELRGARVFFSWLNHVDIKEDNCLDTWVEDPSVPGRGRLRHHLVDFGNSMGVFGWQEDTSAGFSQKFDFAHGVRSLVSFGLWKRPWEDVEASALRGVGNLESTRFDPAAWTSRYPWAPFERFDRFDGVWGARILMRVSPAHVAAAVQAGQYRDRRATAYVTRTLIERQRKIGRHYLGQTSPLESFQVVDENEDQDEDQDQDQDRATASGGARLCFTDPLLAHFGQAEPVLATSTRHDVTTWDFAGRPRGAARRSAGGAVVCLPELALAPDHDGYTIVDITTTRTGTPRNRMLVHLARDPLTGAPRVIGLRRL